MKKRFSPFVALSLGVLATLSLQSFASAAQQTQNKTAKPDTTEKTAPAQTQNDKSKQATNADFLSPMEREIVAEINLARTQPQKYAAYLEELRPLYKANQFMRAGNKTVVTNEGVKGVEDAIKFLKAAKPLPTLEARRGMYLAARDHTNDLIATKQSGHKGSDGKFVDARLSHYGTWGSSIGETIAYAGLTPREIVINFLIDDGNAKRGHRMQLFDPSYTVVGVSCGKHPNFETLCVITFTSSFVENKNAAMTNQNAPAAVIKKR